MAYDESSRLIHTYAASHKIGNFQERRRLYGMAQLGRFGHLKRYLLLQFMTERSLSTDASTQSTGVLEVGRSTTKRCAVSLFLLPWKLLVSNAL